MTIVFVSNFMNHHQLPFSREVQKLVGTENYWFIATTPIDQERIALGYKDENKLHPFVVCSYESDASMRTACSLLEKADVVLWGQAPYELLKNRLEQGKLTIKISERIFRTKRQQIAVLRPDNWLNFQKEKGRYFNKNLYLLCNGAFVSLDYHKLCRVKQMNAFKWGYFTETIQYELDDLFAGKGSQRVSILWVGRLISLKHPESMIFLAERLKRDGIMFELNMIGIGEMEKQLQSMIQEKNLNDCVHMLGAMTPQQVRHHMEKANIFLFTSDRMEGWGAVLNEAMNSGCAVLASHTIGAVPFLIQNGQNGVIFEERNWEQMYFETKRLIEAPALCEQIGRRAYDSITQIWSAENAARSLYKLCGGLLSGNRVDIQNGPCSQAVFMNERDAKRYMKGGKAK